MYGYVGIDVFLSVLINKYFNISYKRVYMCISAYNYVYTCGYWPLINISRSILTGNTHTYTYIHIHIYTPYTYKMIYSY